MKHVSPNQIRAAFSSAMSEMYRTEVPAYATLVTLVAEINDALISEHSSQALDLSPDEDLNRVSDERHGAIRLGTAEELDTMGRIFAVMGMEPVGYYDLSLAGVPVHSTAFRPVERADLAYNPFRVFTSLLRLDAISDDSLRHKAEATLAQRSIFTQNALCLTEKAEKSGGLNKEQAHSFVHEVLETFRWHPKAHVDVETFEALIQSHRLIADVVSFKGPHINHLTPRTLDIDAAQEQMLAIGLPAKAVVEGPPPRLCPILLRQTAFKALDEAVQFPNGNGGWVDGQHTARFGEIEERGVALTPKGRALYDSCLNAARKNAMPAADGSNRLAYMKALDAAFATFPDDWRAMHDAGLAYFKYQVCEINQTPDTHDIQHLLDVGAVKLRPIIYEDFLPVSAAGIFQSNLGDEAQHKVQTSSSQSEFETALGRPVLDEFALYAAIQDASRRQCLEHFNSDKAAAD